MHTISSMLTLLLFISLSSTAFAASKSIVLATHNLCPYGCYDNDRIFRGYAVDTVRDALSRMGIKLELHVVPWSRAQRMSLEGDADGFFGASQNAERDRHGVLSEIIADQNWTWYQLKENKFDPDDKDFQTNATVAAFGGSNMLNWLKKNNYQVIADPPSTQHLVNMLLHKRFDAMLANDKSMELIIREKNLAGLLKIKTLKNKPVGVYFNHSFLKKNPNFLKKFNKLVIEHKKSNNLQ